MLFGRRKKVENTKVVDWYVMGNDVSVSNAQLPTREGYRLDVNASFDQRTTTEETALFRVLIERVAPERAKEILGGNNGKD